MILLLFLFIKGEWIVRWEIPNEKSAVNVVNKAKQDGCNTIFVQTYARGEVLYPSQRFPEFEELKTNKDILKIIINQSHQLGISVHIWINLFYAWSQAPFPKKYNHLRYTNPDWFLTDKYGRSMLHYSVSDLKRKGLPGYFISPFANGIGGYFKSLLREILNKYDIDGVHFDYARFPNKGLDYGKDIKTLFMRKYYLKRNDPLGAFLGDKRISALWEMEKREKITEIINSLSKEIREINPNIIISAACISDINSARRDYAQDWWEWIKEGIIDYAVPMVYSSNEDWLKKNLHRYYPLKSRILPGLGGFLMKKRKELEEQEDIVKDAGFPGYVVFSAGTKP